MRGPCIRKTLRAAGVILATAFRADVARSSAMFVLSSASQLSLTLFAFWLKLLTDQAVEGDMNGVLLASAAIAGSWLFSEITVWISWKIRIVLQERTSLVIDQRLVEVTGGLPGLEHHEHPDYANRVAALRQQRDHLALTIGVMVNTVGLLVKGVATIVLLYLLHPLLLLLPAFAIPSLWGGNRSAELAQDAIDKTIERERMSKHFFSLATTASSGKEVRVFDLGRELMRRHAALWEEVDSERTRAGLRAAMVSAVTWLVFAAGYVGVIVFMAIRAVNGDATVGQLVMALILAGQVRSQVGGAVQMTTSLLRILKVVENYVWLLDYARDSRERIGDLPAPDRIEHGITVENLSFRYPGSDSDTLTGVSLTLPRGSTVAFVGENGAGKTTLVKLLCRFYEPGSGRILVDGGDITRIDLEAWRAKLSVGFQDFAKFEFEARRVVGVGDISIMDDNAAVMAALSRAGGAEVPSALPRGLDTQLGRSFDGGVDLSTGQWQKLALGRAMMRSAPLLLLLDEPTASLDAQTEYGLFERYARAAHSLAARNGGVTILVSHRFSTVRMADLIVVIDQGRVAESGSHEELMQAGGLYAGLYEIQARAYR